jgi:hypothetical protein
VSDRLQLYLDAVEKRAEAATPGPWLPAVFGSQVLTGDDWNSICRMHASGNSRDCSDARWEDGRGPKDRKSNAYFIAAARTDIPLLLRLVRVLLEARSAGRDGSDQEWESASERLKAVIAEIEATL